MNKSYYRQAMKECRQAYLEEIGLKEKDLLKNSEGRIFFIFEGTKIYMPREFYILRTFMYKVLKGNIYTH